MLSLAFQRTRSALEPTLSLEGSVLWPQGRLPQRKGNWFSTKTGNTVLGLPVALSPTGFSYFDFTLNAGSDFSIGVGNTYGSDTLSIL